MKFHKIVLIVLAFAMVCMGKEDWAGFSNPLPIYSVVHHGSGIFMATKGGLRLRGLDDDFLFTSSDGLETTSFYSVVEDSLGVFAISEFGLVAKFIDFSKGWRVINRSFLKNNVRLVPDVSLIHKNILVIAFENRIAFFDVLSEKSLLTIDCLGSTSLSVDHPRAMTIHNDSLYVSLGKKVYSRKIDWDDVASDRRLIDPESWTLISFKKAVEAFAVKNDSLMMFPVKGLWEWEGSKLVRTAVPDSGKLLLNGWDLSDSVAKRNWVDPIRWIIPADDNNWYLVSDNTIFHSDGKSFSDITFYKVFQLENAYELELVPSGGIVAASSDGQFSLSIGDAWSEPYYAAYGLGNGVDAYSHNLKVLSLLPDDHMFYHLWGQYYIVYSMRGESIDRVMSSEDELCFDNYRTQDKTTPISGGTVAAPDGSGFFAASGSEMLTYSLVYFSTDGTVSCAKQVGSTSLTGPLAIREDENGDWILYASARDTPTKAATGGLDVFRFKPPSKNGGRLANVVRTTYKVPDGMTPVDLALDEKNKVLWMVSTMSLEYLELDDDTVKTPWSVTGLTGAEYTSIGVDPLGNVWVGTMEQGAYRISKKGMTIDTLSSIHYTSKNGLLNDNVSDLAIDPVYGMAWFAHENGVSRYKRNDLRDAKHFMTDSSASIKVYPNPFRPKVHQRMIIDNISDEATVSLYNRGGTLVRFFRDADVAGGRVTWDGTDRHGNMVVPGVYYYVVKKSSKVKKGKFIVIR